MALSALLAEAKLKPWISIAYHLIGDVGHEARMPHLAFHDFKGFTEQGTKD